jgi:hypothetical protein
MFSIFQSYKPRELLGGAAAIALLIGGAVAIVQVADPSPPQQQTQQPAAPTQPQAASTQPQAASTQPQAASTQPQAASTQPQAASTQTAAAAPQPSTQPSVPLSHDGVVELQNQLIALGYNPGPADGNIGPGTIAAVQQYDQSHGGNGAPPIDSAMLARLKADPGQRLTYEQVQERSQQYAQSSGSASGATQFGNIVQTLAPIIGAAIANSNANNGPPPGYYGGGPGYYGPPPGYPGY